MEPGQKRRCCSFSLRTFLIIVTLTCVGLAIMNTRLYRQRAAIASLRQHPGATIYYDSAYSPLTRRKLNLPHVPHLSEKSSLPWDAYYRPIVGLSVGQASDDLLRKLRDLDDITFINFQSYNKVTDEGLKHLGTLTNLEYLQILGSSAVTDAGLDHLVGLKHLRSLSLLGTQVTEEGVAELQKKLPECRIKLFPSRTRAPPVAVE